MSKRSKRIVCWEEVAPVVPSVRIEHISHFDARGKRRVYGRGDHFGRLTLNMDVWQAVTGRLFVRFWSRKNDVDWYSFEIVGHRIDFQQCNMEKAGLKECWVPQEIRDEYENWVVSELPFT